jgi:Ulp1 family protease
MLRRADVINISSTDSSTVSSVEEIVRSMAEFNGDGSVDHIAFVYPTGGGMQSIQVRESDIRRLNPTQTVSTDKYLSDTGIDFIAKHIVAGISHQTKIRYNPFVASVLFFTHLNSVLMACGIDIRQFSTTWYAGFIHDHPMILAMNHGNNHFSGTAIWNPWGVEPIVYHYDPLPGYHTRSYIFPPYKAYLCSAVHQPFLAQQEVIPKPKFVQLRGPIQPNSWDCALYTLYFVEYSLSLPASAQTENPYEHFN